MRPLGGGGHVNLHFNLHSSQFVSKFHTVWTGDSPDAYAVLNFFVFDRSISQT